MYNAIRAADSDVSDNDVSDLERYGPWALIAGGSEGVGPCFATELAAAGFNIILLARKPGPLEAAATAARDAGAEVRTLAVDLTAADLADRVAAITADLEVGLLLINAGANAYGEHFIEGDVERFLEVADLNIGARMTLCHHFGKRMAERGRGGILMVGSLSGYTGSPYTLVYNGAKAFSRVFAEGLWYELRPHGVDVVEYVVGAIRTPAMERRGMTMGPHVADPADIAREGLAHLGDGPVFNSELVGGDATAESLCGYPRGPVVEGMADALLSTGIYDA
jgi:short-subunit dehydrogenase